MSEASVLRSDCVPTSSVSSPLYSAPVDLPRPLRVTLIASDRIPGWLSTFIEMAAETGWIDISVLRTPSAVTRAAVHMPLDLRAFLAVERLRGKPSVGLKTVGIDDRKNITVIPAVDARAQPMQWRTRVAELKADLILSLGPETLGETLADNASWGCWSLDVSLTDPVGAGISLLAPILQHESTTAIDLELVPRTGTPITLAGGWSATRGSFWRQREQAFLKLPTLMIKALHRLASGELSSIDRGSARLRLRAAHSTLGFAAGSRALGASLKKMMKGRLHKRAEISPWLLVLPQRTRPIDPEAPEVGAYFTIKAPPGGYWADPCLVDASGRKLLFVEEMEEKKRKGVIACIEVHSRSVRRLGVALAEQHHLSFPQVFPWDGRWYMTVESSRDNRVSLYLAKDFPLKWERVSDLIAGRVCVDPILHHHDDGRWYLFANVAEHGTNTWDELFLFSSEDLMGPFRPHPANPIVSDVRQARPAGRLFRHEGRLIRPAQDCALRYGAAIVFNEIVELSPQRYSERRLSRLAPDWADRLDGCHTYSMAGDAEVLDARGFPSGAAMRLETNEDADGA